MNALDAFSTPPCSAPWDRATTRGMAESVLNLATEQPLPDQGLGIALLSRIFDFAVVVLTILLGISLARIPGWYHRLVQRENQ